MAIRLSGQSAGSYLSAPAGLSTSAHTIRAWVFFASVPSGGAYMDIFSRAGPGNGPGVSLFNTNGGAKLNLGDAPSDNPGSTTIVAGRWYYVAWTRGAVDRVYLNGLQENSVSTLQAPQNLLLLGVYSTAGGANLNGRLAHAAVYERELTPPEIRADMRTAFPLRRSGRWAYYPMRPGTNERYLDYSGNGRTLTAVAAGSMADEPGPNDLILVPALPWADPVQLVAVAEGEPGPTLVDLTGTSAGTSTTEGTPRRVQNLSGVSAGVSATAGAPRFTRSLAGSSGGTSATAGAPTPFQNLTATSAGTSQTQASAPSLLLSLSGASAGQSATTAPAPTLRLALRGASAGTSTTQAAGVQLGSIRELTGVSAGTSTTTGQVRWRWSLRGQSAGNSATTGAVRLRVSLAGISAGTSATTGGVQVAGAPALQVLEFETTLAALLEFDTSIAIGLDFTTSI